MKIPLLLIKDYIPPEYSCKILGDESLAYKTWYQVMYYRKGCMLLEVLFAMGFRMKVFLNIIFVCAF